LQIYILDTCVISELIKKLPHPGVVAWINQTNETQLYLSVITIGELKNGIELLQPSAKKNELNAFFDQQVMKRFTDRIYSITPDVMALWGVMYASLSLRGQKLSSMDSLIAATGLFHHASIVTRNVADFAPSGVTLINPWVIPTQ
jgi:predicted nucleic acid-binding protein